MLLNYNNFKFKKINEKMKEELNKTRLREVERKIDINKNNIIITNGLNHQDKKNNRYILSIKKCMYFL